MEEKKNIQVKNELSDAIYNEAKELYVAVGYNGKSDVEVTAEETISEFVDYLDSMKFIRDFHYLAKAVCFYLSNSPDHIETKKRVQEVYESVVMNDEAFKDSHDRLFLLKYALEDMYGINRND